MLQIHLSRNVGTRVHGVKVDVLSIVRSTNKKLFVIHHVIIKGNASYSCYERPMVALHWAYTITPPWRSFTFRTAWFELSGHFLDAGTQEKKFIGKEKNRFAFVLWFVWCVGVEFLILSISLMVWCGVEFGVLTYLPTKKM